MRCVRSPLWLLLALGCSLRLLGLTVHSLWYDECATVHVATAIDPLTTLLGDRHPPLSFFVFRAFIGCFGESDLSLRLLPALLSCATLCLFAAVVRRRLSPAVALLATALQAVSPFAIWYGQEVRMYAFVEFGSVLAVLGLTSVAAGQRTRGTIAITLGSTIALGSHYLGGTVAAQIVLGTFALPLDRRDRALACGGAVIGALSWAPWLIAAIPTQLQTPWGFQAKMGLIDLAQLPVRWLLIHLGKLPSWLVLVCGALVIGGLARTLCRLRRDPNARLVFTLMSTPVVCALALALVLPPNFSPNYLIAAAPWCLAAVAFGLGGTTRWRCIGWLLPLAAALATVLLRLQPLREDYRAACAELALALAPSDHIVSVTGTPEEFSQAPLRHYLRHLPDLDARLLSPNEARRLLESPRSETRVHVIWRAADYALPTLTALQAAGTVVHQGPRRDRIQHLIVAPRTPR